MSAAVFYFKGLSPHNIFSIILDSLPRVQLFHFLDIFLMPPLPCRHGPQLFAEAQRPRRRKADHCHPRAAQRYRRQLQGGSAGEPVC